MKVGVLSRKKISEEAACCQHSRSGKTTTEEEARAEIVKMPRKKPPAVRLQSLQVEGAAGARHQCQEVA